MKPNVKQTLATQAVKQALQTIERRVNELGVAEPIVAPSRRSGDQILVQLPGVNDVDQAKRIIGTTALLELKLVEPGPLFAGGAAPVERRQRAAGHAGRARAPSRAGQPARAVYYLVRKVAAVTGRDLRNARPSLDENNRAGGRLLAEPGGRQQVRRAHRRQHRQPAGHRPRRPRPVGADDPGRIDDEGRITGNFTPGSRRTCR